MIPKPLFNVTLREEEDVHYYAIEGQETWYPGATTILQAYPKQLYLTPWAAKTVAEYIEPYLKGKKPIPIDIGEFLKEAKRDHKRQKKEAGEIGTAFHQRANKWIKNQLTKQN